jgi:hypothetical protein
MGYRRYCLHEPYPAPVQFWAVCIFLGLITGAVTYGWGLLGFIVLAICFQVAWTWK